MRLRAATPGNSGVFAAPGGRLKQNAPLEAGRFDAADAEDTYTQPVGFGVPA